MLNVWRVLWWKVSIPISKEGIFSVEVYRPEFEPLFQSLSLRKGFFLMFRLDIIENIKVSIPISKEGIFSKAFEEEHQLTFSFNPYL